MNQAAAVVDDQWHVEHLLPWPRQGEDGCIVISWTRGRGHWVDEKVRTPDEAVTIIRKAAGDTSVTGVFASQGRMQSNACEKRSAKLALAFGSVWLDLDGKDFQSPGDGADIVFEKILTRLKDFYIAAGLPRPSVMVWSGGGVHAYWIFDQPVPKERWTVIAQALRAAVEESGLPADLQCTTDAARVLRIAGTENRKPEYENPSLAKVTFPADKAAPNRYPPEVLEAALATHMSAQVVAAKNRDNNVVLLDPKVFPPRSPIPQTELSAGIDADLEEIRSAVDAVPAAAIADEGNWVRFARALAHPASIYRSQAEDLWAILDEASQQAPGYDAEENRQRWLRYVEEARKRQDPITIGTLFHLARSHGWQDLPPAMITPQVTAPPQTAGCGSEVGSAELRALGSGTSGFGATGSMRDGLNASFSSIPHRRWLYGVDLVRGDITLLAAPGGVGKSSLALGMAVSIATGRGLLQEKIWGKELTALYINAEDSAVEMRRRFWAFCLKHNVAEQDLSRLWLLGADDWRVHRLSFLREKGLDSTGIAFFESLLEALRPDLVIIDPLIALCGGADLNDNALMALMQRELKRLATRFDCAVLLLHHTRKTGDLSSADSSLGAGAIVNLARRAVMAVQMTAEEASELGLLPSQRTGFFKTVAAKSNLAPRSQDAHWYQLCSVTLPNAEPPTYMIGDGVQAVTRVTLPLPNSQSNAADEFIIRRAILDTIERGKLIDGQIYPYSPNVTGAKNERALLEDAIAAVANATAPRQWHPSDLKVVVGRTVQSLKSDGWLTETTIKGSNRFRRGSALQVDWSRTPWANEHCESAQQPETTQFAPAEESV
jgi:hypothetical protein